MRVEQPRNLRNVPATIADLAGLDGAAFPGVSLAPYWTPHTMNVPLHDPPLTVFGKYRSLYDDRYHYLLGVFDDAEHLYDYRSDRLDERDLAGDPGSEAVLAAFRSRVARIVAPGDRQADPGVPPADH